MEVSVVAGWGGTAGGVGGVLACLQGAVGPVRRSVEDRAGGDVVVDPPGHHVAGVKPAGDVVVPTLSHLVSLSRHQVPALLNLLRGGGRAHVPLLGLRHHLRLRHHLGLRGWVRGVEVLTRDESGGEEDEEMPHSSHGPGETKVSS